MNKIIQVGDKFIGENQPAFIVAELSGNHMQKLDVAIKLLWAAKEAGADAVKLQTYTPDTITLKSNKHDFIIKGNSPWIKHNTLYDLFSNSYLPWNDQQTLFKEAEKANILIFSSPFDGSAVDFLNELGAPIFKIASPEITDISLIRKCAETGKPVILSTGVAEIEDIELAVKTLKDAKCKDVVILKCTATYPAEPELLNLNVISDMAKRFDCVVGFSDHTISEIIPAFAVSIGAKVIEKHLVLSKNDSSVDAFFSLDPIQFKRMVTNIRLAETSLGVINYELDEDTKFDMRGRRSLYVSANIKKGEVLTNENIRSVRPAFGLHPKLLASILGKTASKNLEFGDRLTMSDVNWE
jgi:pseudaminic acid synthase